MTTTFPHLCCVQQPKQNYELAVLPDKGLEPIYKSCSKLRSPYGFIILRFGKNGTLVSLSGTRKAQKGRRFFVVLLMLCMYHCLIMALVYKYSAMTLSYQMFSAVGLLNIHHSPTFAYFGCTNIYKTYQGHTSILEDDCSPDQITMTWGAW